MSGYPITLQLKGKKVVVIGGGVVASRKIAGLLAAQARITVVSPVITEEIRHAVENGKVTWINQNFKKEYMGDAFLVIAATNNKKVNQDVLETANKTMQLVNIVDNPRESNFHVPASFRKGKLTVTVSTEGASPSFAKYVIRELEKSIEEKHILFLDFLAETRKLIQAELTSEAYRHALLRELSSVAILERPIKDWKEEAHRRLAYYKKLELKE